MRFSIKTYILLAFVLVCAASLAWLWNQKDPYSALFSNVQIQGTLLDLANQPLAGVPLMLYEGKAQTGDCIYACISSSSGKFRMPRPSPGTYHIVAILDKEILPLQPFKILPQTYLLDLQMIYTGSVQVKKPEELVLKPTPKPTPKPNPTTPGKKKGMLEGQVLLENKTPMSAGTMELALEHLETKAVNKYKVEVIQGRYELKELLQGPYRMKATIPDYPTTPPSEIFVFADEKMQVDIQFQKQEAQAKKGADISITVIDISWTPQISAQVILTNKSTGQQREGQTDENGEVIFNNVVPGEYEVKAMFNGLKGRCELQEELMAVAGKFVSLVLREVE